MVKRDTERNRYLFNIHLDIYVTRSLEVDLLQGLYSDFDPTYYGDFRQHEDFFQDFPRIHILSPDQLPYLDFYRHIDTNFSSSDFSKFRNKLDRELNNRIEFVKKIKEAKIFKDVDLQRIIQRFNAQREFIKALIKGESVERPPESIHDTWLSVFGITDERIAISDEEIRNYAQYLRAVNLIVACKEAAGRVSPEVWQKIEERLLTWRTGESIDI